MKFIYFIKIKKYYSKINYLFECGLVRLFFGGINVIERYLL